MKLHIAIPVAALVVAGCSKKEDKEDTATPTQTTVVAGGAPGVVASESENVALVGTLSLGGAALTQAQKGVIAFKLASGKMAGKTKVEVDADGNFAVTVARGTAVIQKIRAELALPRDARDWEALLEAIGSIHDISDITLERLKSMPEEELTEGVEQLAAEAESAGAMTLLVAYDVSGDPVAEAETFQFVGVPTASGKAMNALPNGDLKGDVNLGNIEGTGSDVKAEVAASDAVNLSDAALESLADVGRALKTVKNAYMNDKWSMEPFHFWKSNHTHASVLDQFSDINANSYHGYGFYVPSRGDQGLTYDDVCGDKLVKLTPPAGLTEKSWDGSSQSDVAFYSNESATKRTQGSSRMCEGGGYYAREDVRDGQTSFMLNFGTGGSIQNSPAGLWRLEVDGAEAGRYDLAVASPIVDGKPIVMLPQAKFTTSGANVTGVAVELYRWNGTAYEKITDFAPVKKLVTEFSASITRASDNGEARAELKVNDDGTITGVFDGSESDGDEVRNPAVAKSNVTAFAVYYKIGDTSYRMEFR